MTDEWARDEREWLEKRLANTQGRDAILYEAERIAPLMSEGAIDEVFGDEVGHKVGASAQDNLLEYLRELPNAGYVRSSLLAALWSINPNAIGDEYSVEMAQEVSGPQA